MSAAAEPRSAKVPPNGDSRFTIVVEGAGTGELKQAWSEFCQPQTVAMIRRVQGDLPANDDGAGEQLPIPRRRSDRDSRQPAAAFRIALAKTSDGSEWNPDRWNLREAIRLSDRTTRRIQESVE